MYIYPPKMVTSDRIDEDTLNVVAYVIGANPRDLYRAIKWSTR